MTPTSFYTGKEIMAFDGNAWRANGGDSKTDDFYRKATIVKIYSEDDVPDTFPYSLSKRQWNVPETLLDVRFEHDGSISKGRFARDTKELPYEGT